MADINKNMLNDFNLVKPGKCIATEELSCNEWIPPLSFLLVTIPIDTNYIEIDECTIPMNCTLAYTLYLNPQSLLTSFDTPVMSTCVSEEDCLGSYCDTLYQPPRCSPKSMKHAGISGSKYLSDPYEL
jgi:hypothetical protein